jgi:CRP-like cAMP-binding protein
MAATAPAPTDDAEDPIALLVRKLRLRDDLTEHEAQVLRGAVERVEHCKEGHVMAAAGQPLKHSTLLIDGIVARHKDLAAGQRQITELHVAGDFVDLHGYLLKRLEHHVSALTPARIALFPHAALTRITEREPHLARLLWLSTLMDAAVQRERILSIGRRSALSRIAHLICELFVRLDVVGLIEDRSFRLPITQLDLADATGLTSVHVNRMLRQLRSEGLMTFRNSVVEIHDLEGLERVAEFDRSYLFLNSEPR